MSIEAFISLVRPRISAHDAHCAHCAGELVDGARMLQLFGGDAAARRQAGTGDFRCRARRRR